MNMSNTVISYIRTYTPALVGLLLGALVSWGLPVPTGTKELLTAVLSGAFIAGYYAGVRYLEKRRPALGWLLGAAKQPVYVAGTPLQDKPPVQVPAGAGGGAGGQTLASGGLVTPDTKTAQRGAAGSGGAGTVPWTEPSPAPPADPPPAP